MNANGSGSEKETVDRNGDADDDDDDNQEENIDWTTDDELETLCPSSPSLEIAACRPVAAVVICRMLALTGTIFRKSQANSPASSKMFNHFVKMGFSEKLVTRAMEENEEDEALILDTLLTYSVLEDSSLEHQDVLHEQCHAESGSNTTDDHCDEGSSPDMKESTGESDEKLMLLADMGYTIAEASAAIEKCGPNAEIAELTDYIFAAKMDEEMDAEIEYHPVEEEAPSCSYATMETEYLPCEKKRKFRQDETLKNKGCKRREMNPMDENEETFNVPKPMNGFGIPDDRESLVERTLPEAVTGPPYFYYENVAMTPKGVWGKISRFLYEIRPEFVDSMYFCAATRKRGYIHNLPVHNRFPLLPRPPLTIQQAFPSTEKWWPEWDTRTKLNCILTTIATNKIPERIRKVLEESNGAPTPETKKFVVNMCRTWNLVWVGRNKVAQLEPEEMEKLLGFPTNHTRGGGSSRQDRYKALGNSFQVDTVAYHLSVLKDQFPSGMNVLSLFSGIGGAEVALYRLQIPLKNVVSVEISEVNRNIFRSWWEQTNQSGSLIEVADIQKISGKMLEHWVTSFGGFDLVIGGSPCNNLAGNNRVSRTGLEGEHSSLFFEYFRILELVNCIMKNRS